MHGGDWKALQSKRLAPECGVQPLSRNQSGHRKLREPRPPQPWGDFGGTVGAGGEGQADERLHQGVTSPAAACAGGCSEPRDGQGCGFRNR